MPRSSPAAIIRVAILGCGAMGRLHARVIAELRREFVLAGVYDPNRAASASIALERSVPAFEDEARAITAADLVVVASPIEHHLSGARLALAEGRHVLVEKPVCANVADATALLRAVRPGQHLFVGHSERWNPVVRALVALVPPEAVRTLRLRRTAVSGRSGREHAVLVGLGVHDLDLAAYLTAAPVVLRDVRHVDDDRADLLLAGARGASVSAYVDRRAKTRERMIEVTTAEATYTGDLLAMTLRVQRGTAASSIELPREEPLVAQARAIARVLSGATEPVATGIDGARALALVDEATLRRGADGVLRAL